MPDSPFDGPLGRFAPGRIATGLALALIVAACSPAASPSATAPAASPPAASQPAAGGSPAAGTDPDAALAELSTKVLSTGPFGESPTSPTEVTLTPEEIAKVKAMNATAAIVMHIQGDWTKAQVDGLTTTFNELGIKVIASTNGEGKTEKQVADIETVLVQKPSVVVSIPWSPGDEVAAYRKIVDSGAKLVFADNAIPGFKAGTDYVGTVSADNWGNGVASAHLMAKALKAKNGEIKGTIGVVWFDIDFFVTNQRRDAFRKTIKEDYPGIQIVEDQGFPAGPDLAGGAETVASAMLTRNPTLDGIWAVWDQPAEGVIAAARSAGRNDLIITTEDLSLASALSIKKGEFIYGLGAQRPYDQGVNEAKLAAYALLGKTAPPYVALNALPVTKDNVLEAWKDVYHADPPPELAK
ncbi:MAG: ribose transport system substrate-binding protein [Chloroflexota bacterium]|jgi:ribose transport system substrate-binding protein|nr:ribose transport system substrate-binding protein [Chloroflexota bacterium]